MVDPQIVAEQRGGVIHLRQGYGGQAALGYSRTSIDTYLLSGIAIIFVIFTLVSTKLPHYTLPAFPLLALLLARHWSQGAAVSSPPTTESRRFQVRNHRGRNCVCVDRSCACGAANRGAVFSRVSALSSVSRVFAAEHAICCGRVPGAKSGLVFSLPCPRFSHAAEQASRCRVHERTRSAFYRSADARCGRTFCESTGKLAILYNQWFQHRERQTSRSHAGAEIESERI